GLRAGDGGSHVDPRRPGTGDSHRRRGVPAGSRHPDGHRRRVTMASVKPAKRRPTRAPSGGGQGGGLRERKKQKTRESIQRTALRLFEKQGYEQTTIEQIAAAAEISPST